ncbi:MAG: hypothetical protein Q4A01_06145 [Coriobacteriales bacterium]|nr:hypothetical protein [Coriobacteriales bacterium]
MRKESRNPSGKMAPRVVAWGLSALLLVGSMPAQALAAETADVAVTPDQTEVVEETAGAQTQAADGQAAVEQPVEVAQPAEEVAVEEQTLAADAQGLEEAATSGEVEAPAEPQELEAQATTQRTFALNGQWHVFYPKIANKANGCDYVFTLTQASKVSLAIDNQCTNQVSRVLSDDYGNELWTDWQSSYKPEADQCYLKAGTYYLCVYADHPNSRFGSGYIRVKGSASVTNYPIANNDSVDRAIAIRDGVEHTGLFTSNDAGVGYYKFTLSSTKKVKICCYENDAQTDSIDYVNLYDANHGRTYLGEVGTSGTWQQELSAGTYYIKVSRSRKGSGPYTVKWTTGSDNNKGGGQSGGNGSGQASVARTPRVSYRTHVQRVGWQGYVSDGDMSGTTGRSLRLEGINVKLSDLPCAGGIQYRTHVQRIGWQGWRADGQMAGTSGMSRRLEAIEIRLTGELANRYDVYYRVHCQRFGWMGWAKNGARSGSAGYSRRLEGIQVVLVRKGQPAPGATYRGVTQRYATAFRQR